MSREVLLSVVMTTYNHARYLAEAIESVLMQRTSFGVELVIGEDRSTDNTRAIAKEYVERYPERIRLITSDENVGMRANYRRTIEAACGRYIALLDGDDYFTDPDKLQLQVDMLERNESMGMCYTRSERIDERGNVSIYPSGCCTTDFESMLRRNPAENATVVARRELVMRYYAEVCPEHHPEWLTDDLPMWLWFGANSRVGAIDRPMAVHRVLCHSVSHSPDYGRKLRFCDSLSDIALWYDQRYNGSKMHYELLRQRENEALWLLSYNGGVGEYVERWRQGLKQEPRLAINMAAYVLFFKKIAWRMWHNSNR
ncbi:MAG: glycosyltransferase [Alistipes sp.]|nr:glycosyltransferase [Alistipes sp.]